MSSVVFNQKLLKLIFSSAHTGFGIAEQMVGKTSAEKKAIAMDAAISEIKKITPDNVDPYVDMAIENLVMAFNKAAKPKVPKK